MCRPRDPIIGIMGYGGGGLNLSSGYGLLSRKWVYVCIMYSKEALCRFIKKNFGRFVQLWESDRLFLDLCIFA